MLTIEEIEEILLNYYGDDTERGCYIDGRWFSIDEVLRVLKKHC